MILWVLVLVLAILFIVGVVYSRRNLIWPHLLICIGLFLLAVSFLVAVSFHMRIRAVWQARADQVEGDLERLEEQAARLQRDLRGLRHVARLELHDRGRVWRNLILANAGPNGVVLNLTEWNQSRCVGLAEPPAGEPLQPIPAEPPGEAGAAPAAAASPPAHGLQPGMVVYAFREIPVAALPGPLRQALFTTGDAADAGQAGGDLGQAAGGPQEAADQDRFYMQEDRRNFCRVPADYLGQFRVVDVTGPMATVALTGPVDQAEMQRILQGGQGTTWALYQQMPADSPTAFAGLTPEQIQALMPPARIGLQGPDYQAFLTQYIAQNQPVGQDADPARTWVRVEFQKEFSVDVDAQGDVPLGQNPFDSTGRALVPALRQGEATKFQQGDTALLDWDSAQELIQTGVVKPVEYVFRRDLRDYRQTFTELRQQGASLQDQLNVAQADLESLQRSQALLGQQQETLRQTLENLRHDQQGLKTVSGAIDAYQQQLTSQWQQVSQQLTQVYRANQQLRGQLAAP